MVSPFREGAVTIGRNLRYWRLRRALTQEALAKKAGMQQVTIWRIEQGRSEPRPGTLGKLAEALNVDPAILLQGEAAGDGG